MEKKLRIGIVGLGGIGMGTHARSYHLFKKLKNRVEIVGVCDLIEERAQGAKDKYFPNAKVYTDYQEMLKNPDIDAVDICTPNYMHSVIAVDAFAAGKHVFCEKPDAVSPEEQLKMKTASEESGKLLMVMRNNRFCPSSMVLKQYIDAGNMGEVYAGRCGWVRRRGIPGKGGWFTTKEKSGGGPLIDLGVHMIDLAIWLMGNPTPVAVSGSTYCKFADVASSDSKNSTFGDAVEDGIFDVEDLAIGFIKFDNGASLQIEFSWASNIKKEHRFVELRGTKAGVNWYNARAEVFSEENGKLTNKKLKTGIKFPEGHPGNLINFVEVLLDGAKPVYQPQQGQDMIKILSAIYESARTGREVVL